MDDISTEIKTQWLNETLRFLKNDQEVIYKSPEWPISQVTFYHALIAQRQLSAGLGFKTLYAPLFEAMQVFGLKYNFKVTIENSKDEEKGYLVLEKIIKKTDDIETDSEEESTCNHKLTKKTKQAYLQNKAIVEKNSPTFIKNTLQSLLEFINDEASASIDFNGLAPIEAKFIQNIQDIHDHKFLFYKIFSPSVIEILKKISTGLGLFKNTYDIKVGSVSTNPKTAKREITLIKEPNFGKSSSSTTAVSSTKTPPSTKKKGKLKPSLESLGSPNDINTKSIPTSESISHNDDSKIPQEENKGTMIEIERKHQPSVKEVAENKIDRTVKVRLINVEDIFNNETEKEISSPNANKTKIKIDCKISNKQESKLMPDNERKSTTVIDKINKASEPPPDNSKHSLSRSGQKRAIMEAMSKPMESDRGLRMMKLMGWEGGALGTRGDGIMEPILPSLLLKPKAGLGAPLIKMNENKSEPKTKKDAKETKKFQFLEGVYNALDKGSSVIRLKSFNTKETSKCINNIAELNRRAGVSHNNANEKIMVDKILDKLNNMPEKMLDYSFMNDASELCLRVINKKSGVCVPPSVTSKAGEAGLPDKLLDIDTFLRSKIGKSKKNTSNISKLAVKLYTLLMVADFVDCDDVELNMDFSFGYCKKVYRYMQRVCSVLEGTKTDKIKTAEEAEMLNEISAGLKESFLFVNLYNPVVTVRKLKLASKHRQMVDYYKFFNIPKNDKNKKNVPSDSESVKIKYAIQSMIPKQSNDKKVDLVINSNENAKSDKEEKNTEEKKENLVKLNQGNKELIIDKNENDKDVTDNLLNHDINSEIKPSQSCDTNSLKNVVMSGNIKDSIDVIEYEEFSIIKIVLQDWEHLESLSGRIQNNILNFDYFSEDNYLKCHGIQNGGLVYYCSNMDWFKDILNRNFSVHYRFETMNTFKMKVHINSYIKIKEVLKALEVHNGGLYTMDWTITEQGVSYFVVNIDDDSFHFICQEHFLLNAGIDIALFTIVL